MTKPRTDWPARPKGTVHDLPVWLRKSPGHVDAYDGPEGDAQWLAGGRQEPGGWRTTDGAGRNGLCEVGAEARTDVLAMAQALLYAQALHDGTLVAAVRDE